MITYPPALRRSGFVGPMDGGPMAGRPPARAQRPAGRRWAVRLWLPLTPIFLLLAPFVLLLTPLGYLVPPRHRTPPFLTAIGLGRVLLSFSGAVVHVEAPEGLVHIRIF